MRTDSFHDRERGVTLIELMVALVILSIGILAMGALIPTGSRNQVADRMLTTANYYAQQQLENIKGASWSDPSITAGRHPAGVSYDTLGTSRKWLRFYQVTQMAAPLDNLKKVVVTVQFSTTRTRSVTATTYVRR